MQDTVERVGLADATLFDKRKGSQLIADRTERQQNILFNGGAENVQNMVWLWFSRPLSASIPFATAEPQWDKLQNPQESRI